MPNLLENLILGTSIFGTATGVLTTEPGIEYGLRSINAASSRESLQRRDFSTPIRTDVGLNLIERYIVPEDQDKAAAESVILGTLVVLVNIKGVTYVLSRRDKRFTDQYLGSAEAVGYDF